MKTANLARLAAGLTLVSVLGAGQGAAAQARAAAAPAAGLPVAGPVIPGLCIFSRERAVQTSTVGKYVTTRLQQIDQQIRSELTPEATALQTEGNSLNSAKATLTQDQLQQRYGALQQRAANFDRLNQIRARELQMTQEKALDRINTELAPVLQQVYNARNCGVMIDRNAVFAGNAQMDVTDQVVTGLNGRIQQFTFQKEVLNVPAAASAAPAARTPAAPPKRK